MNRAPIIKNLAATVGVLESIAAGDVVYTLTSEDLDLTDTITYSVNIDPITDPNLFTLDTTSKHKEGNIRPPIRYSEIIKSI